jgi:hypothetical protein
MHVLWSLPSNGPTLLLVAYLLWACLLSRCLAMVYACHLKFKTFLVLVALGLCFWVIMEDWSLITGYYIFQQSWQKIWGNLFNSLLGTKTFWYTDKYFLHVQIFAYNHHEVSSSVLSSSAEFQTVDWQSFLATSFTFSKTESAGYWSCQMALVFIICNIFHFYTLHPAQIPVFY